MQRSLKHLASVTSMISRHHMVLYIDIDIHHGDGMEEDFYTTDRVMTVSFHKYGEYFPGTGDLRDTGAGKGKYCTVNYGIDDESYETIFKPIMSKVMEMILPSAVVLQCSSDSLSGDQLSCFNLTIKGHAKCVEFMKSFNLPMLMLGGGGYTICSVARCWTYKTAVALDTEIPNELPYNDYFENFGPDFKLHISPSNMTSQNTNEYLEKIKQWLLENLRMLPHAPGVQMQAIPEDAIPEESGDEDEEDPDKRISSKTRSRGLSPAQYGVLHFPSPPSCPAVRNHMHTRMNPTCDLVAVLDTLMRGAGVGNQVLLIQEGALPFNPCVLLKDTQGLGIEPDMAPCSHTNVSLSTAFQSAPLTNALPVRRNSLILMRREKEVARTLLTSKKPKESKQKMKKKKIPKRKKVGLGWIRKEHDPAPASSFGSYTEGESFSGSYKWPHDNDTLGLCWPIDPGSHIPP